MSRTDNRNRARYWEDAQFKGVALLSADFGNLQFAPHVHHEVVIAVTMAGAGRYVSRRSADIAMPRRLLVFNPHEPHEGGALEQYGWRYRSFYISETALASLNASISDNYLGIPYFRNNNIADEGLAELFLQSHGKLEQSHDHAERQMILLDALVALFMRHAEPRLQLSRVGEEASALRTAVEYMQEFSSTNLSVTDIAAKAALSEFHFIRVFRKRYGLSPHGYLTQIRLNNARELLKKGASMAETAFAVGFCDQSHLVRHFKKVYGITPGQFVAGTRPSARHVPLPLA